MLESASRGGCLLPGGGGVPGPGGGGVPGPGGCTWSGGSGGGADTPRGQTDTCKNITLAQLRCGR